MAYVIDEDDKDRVHLLRQVESMGIGKGAVLEYIFSLKCLFMAHPGLDNRQLNSRMTTLGWQDVSLDDKALKSANICFKADTPVN